VSWRGVGDSGSEPALGLEDWAHPELTQTKEHELAPR